MPDEKDQYLFTPCDDPSGCGKQLAGLLRPGQETRLVCPDCGAIYKLFVRAAGQPPTEGGAPGA